MQFLVSLQKELLTCVLQHHSAFRWLLASHPPATGLPAMLPLTFQVCSTFHCYGAASPEWKLEGNLLTDRNYYWRHSEALNSTSISRMVVLTHLHPTWLSSWLNSCYWTLARCFMLTTFGAGSRPAPGLDSGQPKHSSDPAPWGQFLGWSLWPCMSLPDGFQFRLLGSSQLVI